MEPVEINAGAWYLRALRADERIDDRPALAELGETAPDYIERRTAQWQSDTAYSWAVCEPATGEFVAEIVLDPATSAVTRRARAGYSEAAGIAEDAVKRFATGCPSSLPLSPFRGRSRVPARLIAQPERSASGGASRWTWARGAG